MREITAEYHSFAIGLMAYCSTPSIRYLIASFLVACFDVNIARPPFERVENGRIHQLDNRRDISFVRGQLVDREILIGVLIVADNVERKAFGDFFEHALRLLGFLEQIGNLRIAWRL